MGDYKVRAHILPVMNNSSFSGVLSSGGRVEHNGRLRPENHATVGKDPRKIKTKLRDLESSPLSGIFLLILHLFVLASFRHVDEMVLFYAPKLHRNRSMPNPQGWSTLLVLCPVEIQVALQALPLSSKRLLLSNTCGSMLIRQMITLQLVANWNQWLRGVLDFCSRRDHGISLDSIMNLAPLPILKVGELTTFLCPNTRYGVTYLSNYEGYAVALFPKHSSLTQQLGDKAHCELVYTSRCDCAILSGPGIYSVALDGKVKPESTNIRHQIGCKLCESARNQAAVKNLLFLSTGIATQEHGLIKCYVEFLKDVYLKLSGAVEHSLNLVNLSPNIALPPQNTFVADHLTVTLQNLSSFPEVYFVRGAAYTRSLVLSFLDSFQYYRQHIEDNLQYKDLVPILYALNTLKLCRDQIFRIQQLRDPLAKFLVACRSGNPSLSSQVQSEYKVLPIEGLVVNLLELCDVRPDLVADSSATDSPIDNSTTPTVALPPIPSNDDCFASSYDLDVLFGVHTGLYSCFEQQITTICYKTKSSCNEVHKATRIQHRCRKVATLDTTMQRFVFPVWHDDMYGWPQFETAPEGNIQSIYVYNCPVQWGPTLYSQLQTPDLMAPLRVPILDCCDHSTTLSGLFSSSTKAELVKFVVDNRRVAPKFLWNWAYKNYCPWLPKGSGKTFGMRNVYYLHGGPTDADYGEIFEEKGFVLHRLVRITNSAPPINLELSGTIDGKGDGVCGTNRSCRPHIRNVELLSKPSSATSYSKRYGWKKISKVNRRGVWFWVYRADRLANIGLVNADGATSMESGGSFTVGSTEPPMVLTQVANGCVNWNESGESKNKWRFLGSTSDQIPTVLKFPNLHFGLIALNPGTIVQPISLSHQLSGASDIGSLLSIPLPEGIYWLKSQQGDPRKLTSWYTATLIDPSLVAGMQRYCCYDLATSLMGYNTVDAAVNSFLLTRMFSLGTPSAQVPLNTPLNNSKDGRVYPSYLSQVHSAIITSRLCLPRPDTVFFSSGRVHGEAVSWYQFRSRHPKTRRCDCCGKYAPRRFRWVKNLCPSCWHSTRSTTGLQSLYSSPYVPWNFVFRPFKHFISCEPMEAVEKEKNILERAAINCDQSTKLGGKRGRLIGFTKPTYDKPPKDLGRGFGVGVLHSVRPCTFASSARNMSIALKNRLFQNPTFKPQKIVWEIAKDNITFLFGGKKPVMQPQPYFRTDFAVNNMRKCGWTRSLNELRSLVESQGYVLDDPDHSWSDTFDTPKKKLYLRVLIRMMGKVEKSPDNKTFGLKRVRGSLDFGPFDFFMKVEWSEHAARPLSNGPLPGNPRTICSPSLVSHLVMGPYMKQLTEGLHEIWGVDNWITYAGGLNPETMTAKLNTLVQPDCRSYKGSYRSTCTSDFTAFDATHSDLSFDYAHAVYKHLGLPDSELINEALQYWKTPKGYTKYGHKVVAGVLNASGRDDTAVLNAILNGTAQAVTHTGILCGTPNHLLLSGHLEYASQRLSIMVLGDDSYVTSCIVPLVSDVQRRLATFGFEAKECQVSALPFQSDFLAMRPLPAIRNGVEIASWSPILGRRLYKHHWCLSEGLSPYDWLSAVTISEIINCSHTPILRDITYKTQALLEKRVKSSRVVVNLSENPYSPWNRQSTLRLEQSLKSIDVLCDLYGFTKADYHAFLQSLSRVDSLPFVFDHPVLDLVFNRDV